MSSSLTASKYICKADNSSFLPASASPAGPSIDQIDRDQDDDFVVVTVLAKKLRTTDDGTIELKQLLVSRIVIANSSYSTYKLLIVSPGSACIQLSS